MGSNLIKMGAGFFDILNERVLKALLKVCQPELPVCQFLFGIDDFSVQLKEATFFFMNFCQIGLSQTTEYV